MNYELCVGLCVSLFYYPRCTMRRAALADKQVDNVQVVVMYGNMQWSQTILQKQKSKVPQTLEDQTIIYSSFFQGYSQPLYVYLTFPAAFGLAPLSNRSSATSTLPYLEATWSGVNPFYSGTNEEEDTI